MAGQVLLKFFCVSSFLFLELVDSFPSAKVPFKYTLSSGATCHPFSRSMKTSTEERKQIKCRRRSSCSMTAPTVSQFPSPFAGLPPEKALKDGSWIKLICGASNEDIPQIRNIAFAYTLAGVDCIDCAADPSIVSAVDEGIRAAQAYSSVRSWGELSRPWIMVSVNDDEDPHFRKAAFDPNLCPADCPRPCEATCPVVAISKSGVDDKKCYGCGRCLSSCPLQLIHAKNYVRSPQDLVASLRGSPVDALEIHTSGSTRQSFRELWKGREGESHGIEGWAAGLKLVAVSFPDQEEKLLDFMQFVSLTLNLPEHVEMLWQTDGRPMSGDVGHGTARASIVLAQRVLGCQREAGLQGGVQLAGGTNDYTATLLERNELFKSQQVTGGKQGVVGAAFGGYARKLLRDELEALNAMGSSLKLEEHQQLAESASMRALAFVNEFKATALGAKRS